MPRGINTQDEGRIQGRNVVNANSSNIVAPGIVTDGLVLHLDAGNYNSYPIAGTTWYDLSGYGYNGTLTNGPTYVRDGGGAIDFDGTNDYARVTSFSGDSANLAISVFSWVYPVNLSRQIFEGVYYSWIINKRDASSQSFQHFASDSYLVTSMASSSNPEISPSVNSQKVAAALLSLNKWQYVGFVSSGNNSGFLKNYINGSEVFSGSLSGDRRLLTLQVDIGKLGQSDNFFWDGNISTVSIYNRVLTPTEIQQNFNATRARFNI